VRLLILSSDQGASGGDRLCPDSDKVGLWGAEIRKILEGKAELDYFAGEAES
jgi:hypothetical protein